MFLHDVSRRITKLTPDNYLKGLILRGVGLGNHSSAEIIEHVFKTPYYYQEEDGSRTEHWYSNERGIRSALTYLKNVGYLSLYDRDEYGNIMRIEQKRPYLYYLTAMGTVHAENPFIKKQHREQRISDEAYRLMQKLLLDDPLFEEAVREFVRTNQVPKLNVIRQKAPIIRNPRVRAGRTEKITILNDDGSEQEVTIEQLQSALLTVDKIIIKEQEHSNALITQQQEIAGYQQQIADMFFELKGKDITLSNIKRRNTGAMRVAQRKDLVFIVTGINPDELSGEFAVEEPVGSEFFLSWGSIWGRKVIGAKFWNRKSFELMADTNPEITVRGHASNELSYEQMDNVGMFISKIRRTGITVDAINDRMLKPVALVW